MPGELFDIVNKTGLADLFVISRFECMQNAYNKHKKDYKRWDGGDFNF